MKMVYKSLGHGGYFGLLALLFSTMQFMLAQPTTKSVHRHSDHAGMQEIESSIEEILAQLTLEEKVAM